MVDRPKRCTPWQHLLVRRALLPLLLVLGVVLPWSMPTGPVFASNLSISRCASSSLRITTYKANVATGSVDELYWIRNDANQQCSLRGFVRTSYVGTYNVWNYNQESHSLVVQEFDALWSSDPVYGGLQRGVAMPSVTLSPRGGMASFWIAGTDEQYQQPNGRPSRCIMSYEMRAWLPDARTPIAVMPQHAGVFFWCGPIRISPMLAERSGSYPPRPLRSYFGG